MQRCLSHAGHHVTVYGADQTVMHYAFLNNYLGIDAISGTDFQTAARQQVLNAGAAISEENVTGVAITGGGVEVTTEAGTTPADFLYLERVNKCPWLTARYPNKTARTRLSRDRNGKTAIDAVYVIGRSARRDQKSGNNFSRRWRSCGPRHTVSDRRQRRTGLGLTSKE